VWHGKIMQRKQRDATAACNIRIRDLERKGTVQSRMGDQWRYGKALIPKGQTSGAKSRCDYHPFTKKG
jgi:hypothetical protein